MGERDAQRRVAWRFVRAVVRSQSAGEATSNLDPATEVAVESAFVRGRGGRTVITIAHRLSTAQRADRVAVMEHGRLVEVASHDELVEQGERYARLWASWQAGLAAT